MPNAQINPNRFLRQWLAHSLVLWPIAAVACILAWLPLAIVMVFLAQGNDLPLLLRFISTLAMMLLPGAAVGYCAGSSELNLMRDHLNWAPDHWVKYSIIGGTVGSVAVLNIISLLSSVLTQQAQLMLAMPLYALFLSIAQWLTIRDNTRDAWLWILGNVVGGIVFSGLLFLNQPVVMGSAWQKLAFVVMWVFAVLGQAAVTGIVLLWLYEHPLPETDEEAEYAHAYVEIHTKDTRRR